MSMGAGGIDDMGLNPAGFPNDTMNPLRAALGANDGREKPSQSHSLSRRDIFALEIYKKRMETRQGMDSRVLVACAVRDADELIAALDKETL